MRAHCHPRLRARLHAAFTSKSRQASFGPQRGRASTTLSRSSRVSRRVSCDASRSTDLGEPAHRRGRGANAGDGRGLGAPLGDGTSPAEIKTPPPPGRGRAWCAPSAVSGTSTPAASRNLRCSGSSPPPGSIGSASPSAVRPPPPQELGGEPHHPPSLRLAEPAQAALERQPSERARQVGAEAALGRGGRIDPRRTALANGRRREFRFGPPPEGVEFVNFA